MGRAWWRAVKNVVTELKTHVIIFQHVKLLYAQTQEEDKAQAIQAGMDNYIIKPAKHTLLKQVILDYLFPEALLSQSKSSLFIKTELTPIEELSEQKSKSPATKPPELKLM